MENKSIQTELSEMFSGLAQQATTGTQASTTVPVTTPVETPAAPATPNEAPVAAAPVVTPDATPAVNVDDVVDSWDTATSTTPVAQPSGTAPVVAPTTTISPELLELASVLGKGEIKSKEDVIKAVAEVKSQAEVLSSLPENLAKAVEIARQGGNYLDYLGVSVVDWAKEDPITLYENYVIDQFTDSNGMVDTEKVEKMLDKIDDDDKELRGRELQRQYSNYQVQQKALYESQAKQQRAAFEQSVRKGIDGLSDIAGFKLSPSHKEELYNDIVRGEDLKQNDVNSRIFNRFITKNWGKIDAYRKTQIKNSSVKKILDDITVPDIKPVTDTVTATPTKAYGLEDYIAELNGGKRKF